MNTENVISDVVAKGTALSVAKAHSVGRLPQVTTQLIFRNVLIHSHCYVNFDQNILENIISTGVAKGIALLLRPTLQLGGFKAAQMSLYNNFLVKFEFLTCFIKILPSGS